MINYNSYWIKVITKLSPGWLDGLSVWGLIDKGTNGCIVGDTDGMIDGVIVGEYEGDTDGVIDGWSDIVGDTDGMIDEVIVGEYEGDTDSTTSFHVDP